MIRRAVRSAFSGALGALGVVTASVVWSFATRRGDRGLSAEAMAQRLPSWRDDGWGKP